MNTQQSVPPGFAEQTDYLPLDREFQKLLVLELANDRGLAAQMLPKLQPRFFEDPCDSWAIGAMQDYLARYSVAPEWKGLRQMASQDLPQADSYTTMVALDKMQAMQRLSYDAVKDVRERVRKFVCSRALNGMVQQAARMILQDPNNTEEAQKYCKQMMHELESLNFRTPDRSSFFEAFEERQRERKMRDRSKTVVTTGLPTLDKLLGGGLEVGRMAIWLGDAKGGKSALLLNHAIAAVRQGVNVLALVYEGSRKEQEARYDANFSKIDSKVVDRGDMPQDIVEKVRAEYNKLRGRLVIRGFTSAEEDAWACSVDSVVQELHEQKQVNGWEPTLLIVDYGDLLTGRDKHYRNATERQTAVYKDLKTLANRGYAMWTATQAQRPDEDRDLKPGRLKARQIADCYDKVRVADFVGSINATALEKDHKVARLFAEISRGSAADMEWVVRADFPRMVIHEEAGLKSPHADATSKSSPKLGYGIDSKPMRKGREQTRAF